MRTLCVRLAPILLATASLAQSRLAPYVATPPDVVERMLRLADVGPRDVVYDLGCGDGRIVIMAAQKFGARGVGVDIDASLVAKANADAAAAGVSDRVSFRVHDALGTDLHQATVVTLYLLAASNLALRPMLQRDLPVGARIVSHNFPMGDWEPDRIDNFTDASGKKRTIYLWRVGRAAVASGSGERQLNDLFDQPKIGATGLASGHRELGP